MPKMFRIYCILVFDRNYFLRMKLGPNFVFGGTYGTNMRRDLATGINRHKGKKMFQNM